MIDTSGPTIMGRNGEIAAAYRENHRMNAISPIKTWRMHLSNMRLPRILVKWNFECLQKRDLYCGAPAD